VTTSDIANVAARTRPNVVSPMGTGVIANAPGSLIGEDNSQASILADAESYEQSWASGPDVVMETLSSQLK
jgi:hypothetical protein